jgi:xanthine dehydrogenase accessory factor
MEYLQQQGMNVEKARHVRAPAGLNIGAKSPEEIAVSVLAEIIQMRANTVKTASRPKASTALPVINPPIIDDEAKDVICGMMVNKSKAKHQTEYQGKVFYFCCAGCKQTFEKSPQQYLVPAGV